MRFTKARKRSTSPATKRSTRWSTRDILTGPDTTLRRELIAVLEDSSR